MDSHRWSLPDCLEEERKLATSGEFRLFQHVQHLFLDNHGMALHSEHLLENAFGFALHQVRPRLATFIIHLDIRQDKVDQMAYFVDEKWNRLAFRSFRIHPNQTTRTRDAPYNAERTVPGCLRKLLLVSEEELAEVVVCLETTVGVDERHAERVVHGDEQVVPAPHSLQNGFAEFSDRFAEFLFRFGKVLRVRFVPLSVRFAFLARGRTFCLFVHAGSPFMVDGRDST